MNKSVRTILLSVISVLMLIVLMNALGDTNTSFLSSKPKTFNETEFYAALERGEIKSANWLGSDISGELNSPGDKKARYEFHSVDRNSEGGARLAEKLRESNVVLTNEKPPVSQTIVALLGMLGVPILLLLGLYFFVIRPAQSGGNQAMSFGRSRARRVGETGTKITFDDVAGIDEAKQELFEIVDFLKNTKKYVALGAKIPKGILLTGPPGVGKTHLARAIAGEAGVPFYHISGSDFVEMFVGVGAARVRDLFETAKAHRPCLIFVDEIDAVGRQRGAGLGGGHDEREQTLNQLLVEMDGFDPNSGVIMIAATNRPDVLDPALLRPGRFDRQLVVDAPDSQGRAAILKVHSKGKPLDADVDLDVVARRTPGFTGADLANSLNEAALLAARRNKSKIEMEDMNEALDRVMAGPERRSRVMDPKEREVIAYHEAGHAVIMEELEHCDPVHKVTILPRGMSLGSTWHLPTHDKFLVSQEELEDEITALLGGRIAEELVFNRVFTGASGDFQRVTAIARAMVCEYGMSSKVGTYALGNRSSNPFLGRTYHEERNYGPEVAKLIDQEVKAIVDRCHQRATDMLKRYRTKMDAVVQALLERETLDREEFLKIMAGETLPPMKARTPVVQETSTEEDAEVGSDKAKGSAPPPRFEPA